LIPKSSIILIYDDVTVFGGHEKNGNAPSSINLQIHNHRIVFNLSEENFRRRRNWIRSGAFI